MRFGFVPSDLLRSCASFIAFSFSGPVSRRTQIFQSVRPGGVFTPLRPLRSSSGKNSRWAHRPSACVPRHGAEAAESRNTNSPFVRLQSGKNRQIAHICSESSFLRTEPDCSGKTNLGRRNDMRMPFCLLALLGLAGCVAETPVTTTTTEVTRTVTNGPVATQPVTREVLVTQEPPPVRVETRTVAPGPSYVWTNGYWQWTGAGYAWVPGHWIVRPRPAAVWVEGHWVRRPGGWLWVAGHWQ